MANSPCCGHLGPESPEVMTAILLLGRLDHGVDADEPGIEFFRHALDHAALARGVRTLKDEDDVALALQESLRWK